MGVTSGGLHFKDTLFDGQKGNIKGTTAKIENEDVAFTLSLLIKTVGNGSGGRLVDDTEDVQAGDETGVLGSLTLGVVEVGGDGDDSVVDGTTEVGLGGLPHLGEDHGRDLLGGELLGLALEFDLDDGLRGLVDDGEGEVLHVSLNLGVCELASDKTLGVEDCVSWVHGDLVLCGITDETLGVGESHERGSGTVSLVVGDDLDAVITEDTHAGVRGTQIDTWEGELADSSFEGGIISLSGGGGWCVVETYRQLEPWLCYEMN